MKKTIEIHRFQSGNQGFHYLYGTIEREVRNMKLVGGVGCVTGPIHENTVPFVFLAGGRFVVVKTYGTRESDEPNAIYLHSDYKIPPSVDRLITKAPEKILR